MALEFEINAADLDIEEQVGAGNTAEVFRGRFKGDVVAIKQLFKHRRMDSKERVSLTREVEIMLSIKHPNLVELYGVSFGARPYRIVTEFCEGGTLFELLHNHQEVDLIWSQRIKMCHDIAAGMQYLHGFNPMILHRDLKSLNLLMHETVSSSKDKPIVKVTDFGLGKMKDDDQANWGKMTCQVGTLHWMAPEVFAGTRYDEKVDIYSYAMVLFEILCRDIPFDEEEPGNIGKFVQKGGRPNVSLAEQGCPEPLKRLMVTCWAAKPQERLSFKQILGVLDSLMTSTRATIPHRCAAGTGPPKADSKALARGPFSIMAL